MLKHVFELTVLCTATDGAGRPSSEDLRQGDLCNCYLVAALGVLADQFPESITAAITACRATVAGGSALARTRSQEEREKELWAVRFRLPGRASRRSIGTPNRAANGPRAVQSPARPAGAETVLVDAQFYVERGDDDDDEQEAGGQMGSRKKKKGKKKGMKEQQLARQPALPAVRSVADAVYIHSHTRSLWPLLIEKAWISLLEGSGYDDICPGADAR